MGPAQKSNPVPLIIFVVLFVASAAGLAVLAMELSRAGTQMNEGFNASALDARKYDAMPGLKSALKRQDEINHVLQETIDKCQRAIGAGDADLRAAMARPDMQALAARVNETLKGQRSPSLLALIQVLEHEKSQLSDRVQSEQEATETERTRLTARISAEAAKVRETQTAVDQRDREIEQLKTAMAQERAAASAEAEGLRARLRTAQADRINVETVLKTRIEQQERYIDELQRKIVGLAARLDALQTARGDGERARGTVRE